jgi:hypothetical protein
VNSKKVRSCDPIPPELESNLLALMKDGRTVEAIKRLRAATGAPLGDCTKWVDNRLQGLGGIPRRRAGPPCPYCGQPLRTAQARQCFGCGMDWHDPNAPVRYAVKPPLPRSTAD